MCQTVNSKEPKVFAIIWLEFPTKPHHDQIKWKLVQVDFPKTLKPNSNIYQDTSFIVPYLICHPNDTQHLEVY